MRAKLPLFVGTLVLIGLGIALYYLLTSSGGGPAEAPLTEQKPTAPTIEAAPDNRPAPSFRRMAPSEFRERMKMSNDSEIQDLKKAAFATPKEPGAWKALADAYAARGQYELAIAVVKRMTHYIPGAEMRVEVDGLVKGYQAQKAAAQAAGRP